YGRLDTAKKRCDMVKDWFVFLIIFLVGALQSIQIAVLHWLYYSSPFYQMDLMCLGQTTWIGLTLAVYYMSDKMGLTMPKPVFYLHSLRYVL
ncbi:MAG TPA: hypothetical protein VM843_07725, partial [Flavisolibacter sp.]|nr:hypothetical protein [Flavisolibacter sp.]